MNDLIQRLKFDNELENKLIKAYEKNQDKIIKLTNNCKDKGFTAVLQQSDIIRLAVCLEYSKFTKEFYEKKGIPLDIFFDTMQDIVIWCENNGNKGLKNYQWIQNHLKGELFKIGRLQYQFFEWKDRSEKYDLLPFDYGEKLIYVHIPQGEKLIFSDCVASLKKAMDFFSEYFPEYNYRFFFSESWLLFEDNWQFMKTGCNILQFQSLFDIVYNKLIDFQPIERIFGKRHLIKSRYPENTSLQKSAKAYIMQGNKLGVGIGIIAKEDISDI